MGRVTLSQTARGKDTPKKYSTKIKTQIHPESQHKLQPKSSKFRKSWTLHQWISQECCHRSSHHKPRESDQFKKQSLTRRVSQTMGKQTPNERKEGNLRKNAKWNKGKSSMSYWVQSNGYKEAQRAHREFPKLHGNYNELTANYFSMEKKIETINKG